MAEIRHLTKAPVIEAILGFQVDASAKWHPQTVRQGLSEHFQGFSNVREQKMFENTISLTPGKGPEASVKEHPVEAFIARATNEPSVVQIRRDGFAYSRLPPYEDWDRFVFEGLKQWNAFAKWFELLAPFNVFVRFINRVGYPLEEFRLKTYFNDPPRPPKDTGWGFGFFRDHRIYTTKNHAFTINSVFSRIAKTENSVDFLLDATISPTRTLVETGQSVESLLPEMRILKNVVFFSGFTDEGLRPYL